MENELSTIFSKILNVYSYGVMLMLVGLDYVGTNTDYIGGRYLLAFLAFFIVVFLDGLYTKHRKRSPYYTALAAILAAGLIWIPTATFSMLAFGTMALLKWARDAE